MKYRIEFLGRKLGSLGHYVERVIREVEASSAEEAKLKAYETHEHIRGGVSAKPLEEAKP